MRHSPHLDCVRRVCSTRLVLRCDVKRPPWQLPVFRCDVKRPSWQPPVVAHDVKASSPPHDFKLGGSPKYSTQRWTNSGQTSAVPAKGSRDRFRAAGTNWLSWPTDQVAVPKSGSPTMQPGQPVLQGLLPYALVKIPASDSTTSATPADLSTSCNAVDGVEVPTNCEEQGLTCFVNEACDWAEVRGKHYRRLPNAPVDASVADLKSYFARPYAFYSGTFSTITSTQIANFNLNQGFINTINAGGWTARLAGMFGYRFKFVIRLQVASTPFQAGRIRLAYVPMTGSRVDFTTRNTTTNGVSMLPGVELDITESTSCVIEIPWVNYRNFMPLTSSTPTATNFDIGNLAMFAYLPYSAASGVAGPSYTLWVHLEDLEFVGAVPIFTTLTATTPTANLGAEQRTSISARLLASGSVVMSALTPLISSFSFRPSWALRAASDIAAAFGWSKPVNTNLTRMITTSNTFQHNVDGTDAIWNLGNTHDNYVAPLPGFAGTNLDEMSFAYLLSHWSAICRGSLSAADSAGHCKYSCVLSPSSMFFQNAWNRPAAWTFPNAGVTPPAVTVLSTPPFYLGTCFAKWRGSFEFRIKFAKTKFHTGRLVVGFIPLDGWNWGPNVTGTQITQTLSPNLDTLDYLSEVWDLRQGNTFEFKCPFVASYEYLSIFDNYGVFNMTVLDAIGAPAAVSPTIPFVVEMRCCPDFEFAQLATGPLCMPVPPGVVPLNVVATANLGSHVLNADPDYCIGERLLSVKQLISKAGFFAGSAATVASSITIPSPGYPPISSYSGGSLFAPCSTFLSYIPCMYAFWRGSLTVDYITNYAGSSATPMVPIPMTVTCVSTTAGLIGANYNKANQTFITEPTGTIHVRSPYYSQTPTSLVFPAYVSNLTTGDASTTFRSNNPYQLWLRGGDDLQYGYFLGTPPLDLNVGNNTDYLANLVLDAVIP
jgi:hypothetical protein